MNYSLDYIELDNFKSYSDLQRISLSDLSVLLGANSSGKSSALQALLVLKQTLECNSHDIELLLSGQYVALGDFEDVINDKTKESFGISLGFIPEVTDLEAPKSYNIKWRFSKRSDSSLVELKNLTVNIDDLDIILKRTSTNKYSLYINEEILPINFTINDLHLSEMYIRFDKIFNLAFVEFLNSIKKAIFGEKTTILSSEEFVSYKVIFDFYNDLYVFVNQKNKHSNNSDNDKHDDLLSFSKSFSDLIDKYQMNLSSLSDSYLLLPSEVKSNIIFNTLSYCNNKADFYEIYNKYNKIFQEYYDSTELKNVVDYEGEYKITESYPSGFIESSSKENLKNVVWTVNTLYRIFEKQIRRLFFLGPIRENPKGLYNVGFEQEPKYVGTTGSNFASVLLHENRINNFILPRGIERTCLCDALNEWALHLNIASSVEVSPATSFGIKVSVFDTQNNKADIMNVGIGTSQVLPVLIMGLLSEENEVLVFEQPELHLHPFAQGRLADFFVALARNNRTVIIETHSEPIILRLRYQILKGKISANSVSVNFFQNCNGTKVALCNISNNGVIEYPSDFKDETQELLNDILMATYKFDSRK